MIPVDRFFSPFNVEDTVHQSVLHDQTAVAMSQLSYRDQEIVRLHFYEELTHAEISVVLDCSIRNVAVRLHRALERLKKTMATVREEVFDHA